MPRAWRSPVAFEAQATAALLREALEALGYGYSRRQGERSFSETVSLDLHERGTPAWRFFVHAPGKFTLETYDVRPRPGSRLGILEIFGFSDEDEPHVRRVLQRFREEAPKPPWSFSFDQRMRIGPFHGAYRESRRAWRPVAADEPIVEVA